MSLNAYKQATQRAESPREAEYRLFGQVTRALLDASRLDSSDVKARVQALDWNRRLWSTLAADCSEPANELPMPLRAQIISLSLWVNRHTSAVMRREEEMADLIEINRMIMQGLAPAGAPAAA